MSSWVRFLSLVSAQGAVDMQQRVSFTLDSPMYGVESIEVVAMDVRLSVLTVRHYANRIYFSEDRGSVPIAFVAELPPGTYSHATLLQAVESAMASARPLGDAFATPLNSYVLSVTKETNKVCLTSNGRVPFALHTSQCTPNVVELSVVDHSTLLLSFQSQESHPFVRGAPLRLYHTQRGEIKTVVTRVIGPYQVYVHHAYQTSFLPLKEWKCEPFSKEQSVHRLLGFANRDISNSGSEIMMYSMSNVAGGGDSHIIHVATIGCHGCSPGDAIDFLDIDTCFTTGEVVSTSSEYHLSVKINPMGLFSVERDVSFSSHGVSYHVIVHAVDETNLRDGVVTTVWHIDALPHGLNVGDEITDVSPAPSPEWSRTPIRVRSMTPTSLELEFYYPDVPHRRGRIKRIPPVMTAVESLVHHHQVLYVRLWLNRSEYTSIVRPRGSDVFGYVRLPPDNVAGTLSSHDHTVSGTVKLQPCVDKLVGINVQIVDVENRPVYAEWALLFRVVGKHSK